jgi:hypothetical protein
MRPRHFCRGRFADGSDGASVRYGFNEAPAYLPGKMNVVYALKSGFRKLQ